MIELSIFLWLIVICLAIAFLIKIIDGYIEDKQFDKVAQHSIRYQNVLRLNDETKYYEDVVDNGNSKHVLEMNSKAKYDRTHPVEGLREFLSLYRGKVERALEQTYRNSVIYEVYDKKFNKIGSEISPEQCEELGIKHDKYLCYEESLVQEAKLQIIDHYSITCYVKYVSPQGRNHYRKHCVFHEEDIRAAIKELDRESEYQASESWRRKNERSRITPSLRYDIMNRDGFRCCICGRSARSYGVELEVDHIVPISKGGSSAIDNLQTLCRDCNRGKGAKV